MKKKPARPPVKFTLSERLVDDNGDLEPIEEWIMRESKRLVAERPDCKEFRERIIKLKSIQSDLGRVQGNCQNDLQSLQAKRREALRQFNKEWNDRIREQKKIVSAAKMAKKKQGTSIRHEEAKYNTCRNRYFTAVRNKVMQNMREICNIQHTWKDPAKKRNIQSAGIQPHKFVNSRWNEDIENEINSNPD